MTESLNQNKARDKIAVLVPCYNESQCIEKVVKDFRENLPEATIYVYDNNSTDGSAEIVKKLEGPKVHLRHEYRQGKGNVVRSMFRDVDADCYLLVDGDDTYPADEAKKLCKIVQEGKGDMVLGDRLSSTYFTENKRRFHNSGNRLIRYLINVLFNSHVKDILTGYRAFSRPFVKNFPVISKGFEIETEMTIHALDKNFLIAAVPVSYRDRPEGSESKLNTYSDGIKVLYTIFTLFKDYRPLLFFGIVGTILIVLGIILFIPILYIYTTTGLVPKLPTLIMVNTLIISGLLSYACGIISDITVKKHRQLFELMMNRPY